MSHKTMIDGVAYEITGGKTLVNGTAYSIKNGMTLVGGTAYEVGFGPDTAMVTMVSDSTISSCNVKVIVYADFPSNAMSAYMGMTSPSPCEISIILGGEWSYPVPVGTRIELSASSAIYLNGTNVGKNYDYIVTRAVKIEPILTAGSYGSYSTNSLKITEQ